MIEKIASSSWKKGKKLISLALAVTVFLTSMPAVPVFAGQTFAEGDWREVDAEVWHELKAGGTQADICVKASSSDAYGEDSGKVTKVELESPEGRRIRGGKTVGEDGQTEFRLRVTENNTYTVWVYYRGAAEEDGEVGTASSATARYANKVVSYEYEVDDLLEKGNRDDIILEAVSEEQDQGAKLIIKASVSDAAMERGVAAVRDIEILADKDEGFYRVEDIRDFEYREPEYDPESGTATFYIEKNGPYYIGVCYEADGESGKTLMSVLIPYEVDSENGIQYLGVEDIRIEVGETFDLMDGVRALDQDGADVAVAVANDGGYQADIPGTYVITYAPVSEMRKRSTMLNDVHERTVEVMPRAAGDLTVESDVHGAESGKTLTILPMQRTNGILNVTFKLPNRQTGRYLRFELPKWVTVRAWPSNEYDGVDTTSSDQYTTVYTLKVRDDLEAQAVNFELLYDSYAEPVSLPGGVDSYLNNKGIVNIGTMKVSGGYRNGSGATVEVDRQEIGEFVTAPVTDSIVETPLGMKKNGVFSSVSAVHQVPYDSQGKLTFSPRPAAGSDSSNLFFLNTSYLSGRPYRIESLRVFAPENFKFSVSSGYAGKITLGQNVSGIWYADVLVKSDDGSSLKGLVLEKEDGYTLVPGTFTSLPSVVTYTTYGQNGGTGTSLVTETYETTPLLSIVVASNRVYLSQNVLKFYSSSSQSGEPRIYTNERTQVSRIIAYNYGSRIKIENGIEYYSEPDYDGSNLVLSFKMPGTNQIMPVGLSFHPSSQLGQFPSSIKVQEVRLILTDGTVKFFTPQELGMPSDLTGNETRKITFPKGDYLKSVDTVDIVMDKFYASEMQIYLYADVNPDIEKTLSSDGTLTLTSGASFAKINNAVVYSQAGVPPKIRLFPRRVWELTSGSGGGSGYLSYYYYIAGIAATQGIGTTVTDIEISYDFTDADDRSKFLDVVRIEYPGTIIIESAGGDSRSFEVKSRGSVYLNPWPDDHIKKLIIRFPSITKNREGQEDLVTISGNMSTEEWKQAINYLGDRDTSVSVNSLRSATSSAWTINPTSSRIGTCILLTDGVLSISESPDKVASGTEYTEYQGNTLEYALPDYRFDFTRGFNPAFSFVTGKFRWMYPDTYVFLNAEDSFSFVGVESPWKYVKIPNGNGTIIKLYREDAVTVNGSTAFQASLPAPKLKFNVLQGGTATKARPVKALWFDMDALPDLKTAWLTENATRIKVPTDRFEPGTGLTDHNVLKYVKESDFREVNIVKSNKTGMFLTAGVNGSYIGEEVEGKSGDAFQTRVFVQTGASVSNNYEAILTLPKNGVTTTDELGNSYTSEYSMSLDGAVFVTSQNGTRLKALYQMSGGTGYVEAGLVADWKQVTKVKLVPEIGTSVAAGTEQVISLSLSAASKAGLGDQSAYLGAEYNSGGISGKCKPVSYKLTDYMVSINGWSDNNENGHHDTAEAALYGYGLDVYESGRKLTAGTDYIIRNVSNPTVLVLPNGKNLSVRLDLSTLPSGSRLLPDDTTDSSFDKGNGRLDIAALSGDEDFNLGIVKLGTLTVEDLQVKKGLSAPVQTELTGLPATAPTQNYVYTYTVDDEAIAGIEHGVATGRETGLVDVRAAATNSFGDTVEADFRISVGTNNPPTVTARDWTVIEGDTISDLWNGVVYDDLADTYPAMRMNGTGNRAGLEKSVTVWTDPSKTDSVTLGEAVGIPNEYTVTYRVKDEDNNITEEDGRLMVYGKLQAPAFAAAGHYYLPVNGSVTLPPVSFTFMNTAGVQESVEVNPDAAIQLAGRRSVTFTATHPKSSEVSADATPGAGRQAQVQGTVYVDTDVKITGIPAVPTTIVAGSIDLNAGITASYTHYDVDNVSGISMNVPYTVSDTNIIPGGTVMLAMPGIYTYTYSASAGESFVNGSNEISETRDVHVIGKAEVEVPSNTVYVTPDQAGMEAFIRDKAGATASYIDENGVKQNISEANLRYDYEKTGSVISKVTITASIAVGGAVNTSDPATVNVVVRQIPQIQASPIVLRETVGLSADNIDVAAGVVLVPADADNEYSVKSRNINPEAAGKYKAVLTARDRLTLAERDYDRDVYVNGSPVIQAKPAALYTHESTGEAALIAAVKNGVEDANNPGTIAAPTAYVIYAGTDGVLHKVSIDEAHITYAVVPGYQTNTEGIYQVLLTVNDASVLDQAAVAGLTPVDTQIKVAVTVSDRSYQIAVTDGNSGKGTFEEGAIFNPPNVIHGNTIAQLPTPKPEDGYHFDGYRTGQDLKAKEEMILGNGTVITAGGTIPSGSLLTEEQAKNIVVEGDLTLEAVFSATPVVTGSNVQLYANDRYDRSQLGIIVTDLDDPNGTDGAVIVYDDGHVNTAVAGTYQIKVSVTDSQGNHQTAFVYAQVFGHSEISVNSDLNLRVGDSIGSADIISGITASYKKPAEIPSVPWDEADKANAAVTEELITVTAAMIVTPMPDSNRVGLREVALKIPGAIPGKEVQGSGTTTKKIYIHGNPVIMAKNVFLFTHESVSTDALITAVKKGAIDLGNAGSWIAPSASIVYVNTDGTLNLVEIDFANITYAVEPGYQPVTEGIYPVTLTVDDTSVINRAGIAELVPVETQTTANVNVSNRLYTVTISDGNSEKGTFEEGPVYSLQNVVHGSTISKLPTPKPAGEFHFDGYKAGEDLKAKEEMVLGDGTVILAGGTIPSGSILTGEQVKNIVVEGHVNMEAVFSATPVVSGTNVQLYVNEDYSSDLIGLTVTDGDDPSGTDGAVIVIDDSHVDTKVLGTYQVKVLVADRQENRKETYFYVQVFGRPEIEANTDLNQRAGTAVDPYDITGSMAASYKKPVDVPVVPWDESNKINGTVTEQEIAVTESMINTSLPDSARMGLLEVVLQIPGAIAGKEEKGSTKVIRNVLVHGNPVIQAEFNELFTHLSVDENTLAQVIRTGEGSGIIRRPATAYVEIVRTDGTIDRRDIDSNALKYRVEAFVPLTEGSYKVVISVDDSEILTAEGLDQDGLTPVTAVLERGVAVGNRFHEVSFESGENGSYVGGKIIKVPVVHGKTPAVPEAVPDEGYEFAGWKDMDGNWVTDIADYPVTSDTRMTSVFEKKVFTVRFIGKWERVLKTEQVKYNESATAPKDDRDVTDSLFDGWDKDFTKVKSNMDVYAKYGTISGGDGGGSSGGNTGGGNTGGGNTGGGNTGGGSTGGSQEDGNEGPGYEKPDGGGDSNVQVPDATKPGNSSSDGRNPGGTIPGDSGAAGSKNPHQELDDGTIPMGNLNITEKSFDGNHLPLLDENQPIEASKNEKKDQTDLGIRKIGGQEGNAQGSTDKDSITIPANLVPSANVPEELLSKVKQCVIHFILLGIALIEGLYLIIRRKKNKEELEKLRESKKAAGKENQ